MKCQNCKAVLPSNTRICEYCDTKVEEPKSKHGEFLDNLQKKLMEVDDSALEPIKQKDGKNLLDMASESMNQLKVLDKARKKKVLIIQNFNLPSNRNDLFDLLLHASTTAKSLGTGIDQIANKGMMNAWHAKAAQAYHKLLVIAEDDEKLQKRLKPFEKSYGMENIATPMSGSKTASGDSDASDKNKWVAFLLAWVFGYFGAHRFYVGKIGTGILMLCTFGGFMIWVFVDMLVILTGGFKDSKGKSLK
jgi:hypothetical protein